MARRITLSDLPSHEEVLEEQLKNPEFRAEWERTALARAIATRVLAYRLEHNLSQTALAAKLGVSQPAVARLESGEHNPRIGTLARISSALGIELVLDFAPANQKKQLVTERAKTTNAVGAFDSEECSVLFAAT